MPPPDQREISAKIASLAWIFSDAGILGPSIGSNSAAGRHFRVGVTPMLYRVQRAGGAVEHPGSNQFLAALPPDDLAVLSPHLRTVLLEACRANHFAQFDAMSPVMR
jgi:hypothetical protein